MSQAHLYILLGNDEYAIQKRAVKFASIFSDPTAADMNTSRLDARTASENDLATAVGSMPFLAAQRLVLLENASKKFTGLEGHKRFAAFLDSVPPSTLVVVLEIDDLKEKDIPTHWLVKWAGKAGEKAKTESFFLPRPKEMPGWIAAEAKRQGGSIESAAAARLAEMTGENTRQAAQEITKLLTYVNFAHAIGLEDVEAVSIVTAEASIFDFVDALSERNGRKTQKLLAQMLESQDAFEIFPMVIRQFRLLILARDVMDDGGQLTEAAQAIGGHPFVAEKAWGQARKFQMETLELIYRRLLSMDEAAKTGGMPLDSALDMFVVELTK